VSAVVVEGRTGPELADDADRSSGTLAVKPAAPPMRFSARASAGSVCLPGTVESEANGPPGVGSHAHL
jgi:hypothetical protein